MEPDDVQLLQLSERLEGWSERWSVLYAKLEITETQMLQVGEDRLAERVEERGESGGADEVLGEWPAGPPALLKDAISLALRKAERLFTRKLSIRWYQPRETALDLIRSPRLR